MFAICDIETTGSNPYNDRIIDIAIILHDGEKVIDTFHSNVNPQIPIPSYIQKLTHLNNEKVALAPLFEDIAPKILALTQNTIFVAHNVSFDYNFLKNQMQFLGYEFNRKKLCTIKLGRRIFPNLQSYGLDNIIKHFNFEIDPKMRHTALGDTIVTTNFFELLLKNDSKNEWNETLNEGIDINKLNPDFPIFNLIELPEEAGLIYFYNENNDLLYTAHAENMKQHGITMFKKNTNTVHRLKNEVKSIDFESCLNAFHAEILYLNSIRKTLPELNLNKHIPLFTHYIIINDKQQLEIKSFFDANDRVIKYCKSAKDAQTELKKLLQIFSMCFMENNLDTKTKNCTLCRFNEQCIKRKNDVKLIRKFEKNFILPYQNFIIIANGNSKMNRTLIDVENGQIKGFGTINIKQNIQINNLKDNISKCNLHFNTTPFLIKYIKSNLNIRIIKQNE
jgi:DNA polymerase-3 subunit epsilon